MKTVKENILYSTLLLVVLILWFDQCDGLIDSSVPEIFLPFGREDGDSVVTPGNNKCDGPIRTSYTIFNYNTLYVSSTCTMSIKNSRWRTAAILKIENSQYLRNHSSDHDQILREHVDEDIIGLVLTENFIIFWQFRLL